MQGKITACSSHKEKGVICQLAYDWLEVDDQPANQKLKKDLFVQIWMCKIHDYMEKEQVGTVNRPVTFFFYQSRWPKKTILKSLFFIL